MTIDNDAVPRAPRLLKLAIVVVISVVAAVAVGVASADIARLRQRWREYW